MPAMTRPLDPSATTTATRRAPLLTLLLPLLLAGCASPAVAPSDGAPDRLTRLKADPPGLVIFRGWGAPAGESPPTAAAPAPAPAPAASAAAAAASAPGAPRPPGLAASPAAAAAAPSAPRLPELWRRLPPPTGQNVQQMKQLNDAKGIEVPTAASRASEASR